MKSKVLLLALLTLGCFGALETNLSAQPPVTPITYKTAYEVRWNAFPCRIHRYFATPAEAMLWLGTAIDDFYYVGPVSVPSTYPLTYPGWEVMECVTIDP